MADWGVKLATAAAGNGMVSLSLYVENSALCIWLHTIYKACLPGLVF